LAGRLRHGGHPILTWNVANAVVTTDAAGNRKLDKSKITGRIDGAQALAMACGAMARGAAGETPLPASPWEDPAFRLEMV
jgi:phage terminase large subunit-like protein